MNTENMQREWCFRFFALRRETVLMWFEDMRRSQQLKIRSFRVYETNFISPVHTLMYFSVFCWSLNIIWCTENSDLCYRNGRSSLWRSYQSGLKVCPAGPPHTAVVTHGTMKHLGLKIQTSVYVWLLVAERSRLRAASSSIKGRTSTYQ